MRVAPGTSAPSRRRGTCCDLAISLAPVRAAEAAELFKVLGDPTRLSMLATLRQSSEPICICDFTAAYDLSQPTVSHHMGKLKAAGLVEAHKEGIWVFYRVVREPPAKVARILAAALG